jgi:hypothetical protein
MTVDALRQFAVLIWGNPIAQAVLLLLFANVLSDIGAALYTKTFALATVADWIVTRALPYVLGALVVQLATFALPDQIGQPAATATWAFVDLALIGHILGDLQEMGIPIPIRLTTTPKAQAVAEGQPIPLAAPATPPSASFVVVTPPPVSVSPVAVTMDGPQVPAS